MTTLDRLGSFVRERDCGVRLIPASDGGWCAARDIPGGFRLYPIQPTIEQAALDLLDREGA